MNPTGAVFQPELIQLMKTVLDDATAMLRKQSHVDDESGNRLADSGMRGKRRARSPGAEKFRAIGRRRLHALFS